VAGFLSCLAEGRDGLVKCIDAVKVREARAAVAALAVAGFAVSAAFGAAVSAGAAGPDSATGQAYGVQASSSGLNLYGPSPAVTLPANGQTTTASDSSASAAGLASTGGVSVSTGASAIDTAAEVIRSSAQVQNASGAGVLSALGAESVTASCTADDLGADATTSVTGLDVSGSPVSLPSTLPPNYSLASTQLGALSGVAGITLNVQTVHNAKGSNAVTVQGMVVTLLTVLHAGTKIVLADASCGASGPDIDPVPSVSQVRPPGGPTAGGTSVTITGSGFTSIPGTPTVDFGTAPATDVTVVAPTELEATAPSGTPGPVSVTVSDAYGTSPSGATFTYVTSPTIDAGGLSPSSGPTTGGTTVTIRGNGFTSAVGTTTVDFGATTSPIVDVVSSSEITAASPAGSAGTVDVSVVDVGGSSNGEMFTYEAPAPGAPVIQAGGVSPSSGPATGGTPITIKGENLSATGTFPTVDFGTVPASVTAASSTQVMASSPPGSVGQVEVTVKVGSTSSNGELFTYLSASTQPTAPPFATFVRIYGQTADATAAAELEHQFPSGSCPGDTGTRSVILATDANYPDALASAYLARWLGTGTLLTPRTTLSQPTETAIREEGITRVDVVGGPLAVSTAVVSEIDALPAFACGGSAPLATGRKIEVTRIWGQTAYTTAEQIAEKVPATEVGSADLADAYDGTNSAGGDGGFNDTAGLASPTPISAGSLPTAILASGQEFPDAEAASTLAYAAKLPILLTLPSSLSPQASSAIATLGIKQVIVMGGQLAVSNDVVAQLQDLGVSVLRTAGVTYTDTAVQLAKLETAVAPMGFGWSGTGGITVARGDFFTDGLAGADVAADAVSCSAPEPLVLTFSPSTVGGPLTTFLRSAGASGLDGDRVTHFTILGGPLAVKQTTIDAMGADL
jgi:putative cell wall-binding protein